jgi:hypothetical protein
MYGREYTKYVEKQRTKALIPPALSLLSTKCVSHPVSLFSLPPGPTATLHLRVVVLLFRWGVWQFYSKKADRGTTWHFSDGGRKLASCQLMKSCPLSW